MAASVMRAACVPMVAICGPCGIEKGHRQCNSFVETRAQSMQMGVHALHVPALRTKTAAFHPTGSHSITEDKTRLQRRSEVIVAKARGRSIFYETEDTFVLMEPGQDEVFVTTIELRARLRTWLERFPTGKLPDDLAKFDDLDAAVEHLMASACELEVGAGKGSVQWFEVRLES